MERPLSSLPPPRPPVSAEPVAARAEAEAAGKFVSESLRGDQSEDPLDAPEPLPVGDAATPAAPGTTLIDGIYCSHQHFNSPNARYCGVCGISMVHVTHDVVKGPRPPLGVLVADDGATFVVDSSYVVGREPEGDADVVAGDARPLTLEDSHGTMSRIHARLTLDGWDVELSDAGSSNGTHVAAPGAAEWTRLSNGERRTISAGSRLLLGHRVLVYETPHIQNA